MNNKYYVKFRYYTKSEGPCEFSGYFDSIEDAQKRFGETCVDIDPNIRIQVRAEYFLN